MRIALRYDPPPRGAVVPWFQAFTKKPWEDPREKDAVKNAGFWWDGARHPDHTKFPDNPGAPTMTWWTTDPDKAIKFLKYAEVDCAAYLAERAAAQETALHESRAHDTAFEIPVPTGCVPRAYQKAGTAYAVRNLTQRLTPVDVPPKRGEDTSPVHAMPYRGVLLGDDPGLGKTVQALCVLNVMTDIRRVLVVAPANAVMVWVRHADIWLTGKWQVHRVGAGMRWPTLHNNDDDTNLMVVTNYEQLKRHQAGVHGTTWGLLIVDEAHFIRNPRAARTQHVLGVPADRRIYCTGTPVPKQIVNLWPLVSSLDPWAWHPTRGFFPFAKRYAAAERVGQFWDFSGASNLPELQDKLRSSIMVRRRKPDVLTELPPKVRQIVEVDPTAEDAATLKKIETALAPYENQFNQLLDKGGIDREAFHDVTVLRHQTAMRMVPYAVEHIREAMETEKVIVFAWHHDVIDRIMAAFEPGTMVKITGSTPADDSPQGREALARRFQGDPTVRGLVGNILAAGTALTLTASSRVVFVEEDFIPANITQAEDRAHRFGQRDSVLVEHLVFAGSIMVRMIGICIERQKIADQAMDEQVALSNEIIDEVIEEERLEATSGMPVAVRDDARVARPRPAFPVPPMGDTGELPLGHQFLLGGHAIFTVSAEDGSWRFTYRVQSPRPYTPQTTPNPGQKYFVGVLTGPENTRSYSYAGVLDPDTLAVRTTAKSKVQGTAPSMVVLHWLLQHLIEGRSLPEGYRFWHMGRCGRCGRPLTTPESITLGIGPVCLGL